MHRRLPNAVSLPSLSIRRSRGRAAVCPATWLRPTSIRKISAQRSIFSPTKTVWIRERIGILGICGWGGFAINAAANDTRIKVTVASTMYDISRCTANGYFDQADNADARYEMRRRLNAQRTEDYRNGSYVRAGGVVDPVPADAPQFVRDYHAYYKTSRGYHARSLNSTQGWNATSNLAFLNAPILAYATEIRSAVMVVHGEKAHSRYMGEDAFKKLQGDNKRLLIVPGANHTDLYDKMEIIPFDEIAAFYREYLK